MVYWLTRQSSNPAARDRFPGRREYDLQSDVDIVNPLLKTNGRETEGLMLLFL